MIFGDPAADTLLIQMVDNHDLAEIEQEISGIAEISGRSDFCLAAIKVNSWNQDLSPWKAPAVFGNEDFGDGAQETLEMILQQVIPSLPNAGEKKIFIGGYSLSGLFALWAVYQTDVFAGAAAVSPSVWFPGFTQYVRSHPIRTGSVYLSLGDKEEKTRNAVMAQVGNAIREIHAYLRETGTECTLEWNQGNHFKEPGLRTAKGFAWLLADKERKNH